MAENFYNLPEENTAPLSLQDNTPDDGESSSAAAAADMTAVINRRTNQPYGASSGGSNKLIDPQVLKILQEKEKRQREQIPVASFPEFVKNRAALEKMDLATMDDAHWNRYAQEYGTQILPLHYQNSGVKLSKEAIKALPYNFSNQVMTKLPSIRAQIRAAAGLDAEAPKQNTDFFGEGGKLDRAWQGLTTGVAETIPAMHNAYLGLKSLVTTLDPEDIAKIAENQNIQHEMAADVDKLGTAGTVGNVVGQLASFLIPVGGEAKLAGMIARPVVEKAIAKALANGATKEAAAAAGKVAATRAAQVGAGAAMAEIGAGTARANVAEHAAEEGRAPTGAENVLATTLGAASGAVMATPAGRAIKLLEGMGAGVTANLIRHIVATGGVTAASNAASTVLARAAEGKDVTSPEALEEIWHSAKIGGTLGGILGGLEGMVNRSGNVLQNKPKPATAPTNKPTAPEANKPVAGSTTPIDENATAAFEAADQLHPKTDKPEQQQAHYQTALDAFKKFHAEEGSDEATINAAIPEFNKAWAAHTKATVPNLATGEAAGAVAKPFKFNKENKKKLADLGWSKDQIKSMTAKDAEDFIVNGVGPKPPTAPEPTPPPTATAVEIPPKPVAATEPATEPATPSLVSEENRKGLLDLGWDKDVIEELDPEDIADILKNKKQAPADIDAQYDYAGREIALPEPTTTGAAPPEPTPATPLATPLETPRSANPEPVVVPEPARTEPTRAPEPAPAPVIATLSSEHPLKGMETALVAALKDKFKRLPTADELARYADKIVTAKLSQGNILLPKDARIAALKSLVDKHAKLPDIKDIDHVATRASAPATEKPVVTTGAKVEPLKATGATENERKGLKQLGWSDEEIDKMKPTQVKMRLDKGIKPAKTVVPEVISEGQRKALTDLGWSDEDINKMDAETARQRISIMMHKPGTLGKKTVTPETKTEATDKLPDSLSKSSPAYGNKKLKFESDIDKAAYIVARDTLSKGHAAFLEFLARNGMDQPAAKAHGNKVKAAIKELANKSNEKEITVPKQELEKPPETPPPKGNALKKAEVGEQGGEPTNRDVTEITDKDGFTTSEAIRAKGLATPEEKAAMLPGELALKTATNLYDVLRLKYITDFFKGKLEERLISNLLKNPYIVELLKKGRIKVINPDDVHSHVQTGGDIVGRYEYKDYRSPEQKLEGIIAGATTRGNVTLAGSGWKFENTENSGVSPITVLHEILHAALQRTINAIARGEITDPHLVDAYHQLDQLRHAIKSSLSADKLPNVKDITTYKRLKYASSNIHELVSVSLTDPRAQNVLKNITIRGLTAWMRLKDLYTRLIGKPQDEPVLARIFDLTNKLIEYRGETANTLETLHSREDTFAAKAEKNTPERIFNASAIREPVAPPDERAPTVTFTENERRATALFDKLKPLTQFKQKLAALGKTLSPKQDIDYWARAYQSLAAKAVELTQLSHIAPFQNKLAEVATRLGMDVKDFAQHLAAWYTGKNALQVNERGFLEGAKLTEEGEAARQEIKKNWFAGKYPNEGEYLNELKKLLATPDIRKDMPQDKWASSGITNKNAHLTIRNARQAGITDEIVNEIEPFRQQLEDFINENYKKSSRFSAQDEVRRAGVKRKYYVPLKGFADPWEAPAYENSGPGAFTKGDKAMGGRATLSANPILNMMQEALRSAKDVHENDLTRAVLQAAKTHGKEMGASVRIFDHEQALRDAINEHGDLSKAERLGVDENTVIHNAGGTKFAIKFSKDNDILNALKSIPQSPELNWFTKRSAKVISGLSRIYTTLNPAFLLWYDWIRDTGFVGYQLAHDLGAGAAVDYAARYWRGGGPLRALNTYFGEGGRVRNALERQAFDKTQFAKSLQEIAEYGGDLSMRHAYNTVSQIGDLAKALNEAQHGKGAVKEAGSKAIEYLDTLGTVAIMSARVSAYETYLAHAIKSGRENTVQLKREAAMFSRRLLDYQQRGNGSAMLNNFMPFARVSLTQADRLMETFKKPDGAWDLKKLGTAMGVGMAMGVAYSQAQRAADPENWKKIQESTINNSYLLPTGNGEYYKLPIGYGLPRLMLVPGVMLDRILNGETDVGEGLNTLRNTIAENLTPFKLPEATPGGSISGQIGDILQGMSPPGIQQAVEIARNKGHFGEMITPPGTHEPRSDNGFKNTPEFFKTLAHWMNVGSGGTIDVYPESIAHMLTAFSGGIGTAAMRTIRGIEDAQEGKEFDLKNLPFVPSIKANDAKFYEGKRAHEKERELQAKAHARDATDQDKERAREFTSRLRGVYRNTLQTNKEASLKEINDAFQER